MEERGFLGNRVKLARVAGEKGGMFSFLGCFVGEWGYIGIPMLDLCVILVSLCVRCEM